jgi:hypothetical protein
MADNRARKSWSGVERRWRASRFDPVGAVTSKAVQHQVEQMFPCGRYQKFPKDDLHDMSIE